MSSKEEMIISALQERVGQLVASYETQIAFLRAELTSLVNNEKEKKESMEKYSQDISRMVEE